MDVIVRLPESVGQAADAASAYTHVRIEHAPKKMKTSKSQCPDTWTRLPRHKRPKSWSNNEDQSFLLRQICMVTHLLDQWEKGQFEKVLSGLGWRKYRVGNADSCIESKVYSFGVRDGHQNVWKDKSPILCGRNCWNWLIRENGHHFLD